MKMLDEDKFDILCYARGFNSKVAEELGFDQSEWESDAVIGNLDKVIDSQTEDLLAKDFDLAIDLLLSGEEPNEEIVMKVAVNSYAEGLKKEDRKLSVLMEAFGKAAVTECFLTITQLPKEDINDKNVQEYVTFWTDMKKEYSGNDCETLEGVVSKRLDEALKIKARFHPK